MGADVGRELAKAIGDDDGLFVGALVGLSVFTDGDGEGRSVGDLVGLEVGVAVEPCVGDDVGVGTRTLEKSGPTSVKSNSSASLLELGSEVSF